MITLRRTPPGAAAAPEEDVPLAVLAEPAVAGEAAPANIGHADAPAANPTAVRKNARRS